MTSERSGRSSLWQQTCSPPARPRLVTNAQFEVVVVGAGITGVTLAFELARSGKRVALIDRDRIGSGVSGRTTAHLTALPDVTYQRVARHFGDKAMRALARGLTEALDYIEERVEQQGISCDFQRVPAYLYAEQGQDPKRVEEELAAMSRAGLRTTRLTQVPLPYATELAVRVDHQALFHPLGYLAGLCSAAEALGLSVYEQTRCVGVEEERGHCLVRIDGGLTIQAEHVVLATHTPIGIDAHQSAMKTYRSYALAARLTGSAPRGLFYDSAEPYHYLRNQPLGDGEVWLVGGGDHLCGQAPEQDPFAALEEWTRQRFTVKEFVARWSAQVYEPADGLPYIGLKFGSSRIWFATGYQGDGFSFGTLAAKILADEISQRPVDIAWLFSPKRFKITAGAGGLLSEGLESIRGLVARRVIHPDRSTLSDIPAGEGRVVRQGGAQLAVYKWPDGRLSAKSAVCPHMKCLVSYNRLERSWDCPCHGSRFGVDGKVIEGPALSDLADAQLAEKKG